MKISDVIQIINYGKYSRMFVNYLIHTTQDDDLLKYLRLLKSRWILKNEALIERAESDLLDIKKRGLQYLVKIIILDASEIVGDKALNRKYYLDLKQNFKYVSPPCRNMVGKAIKANMAFVSKDTDKDFRMWSEIYKEDDTDTAVLLSADARREVNKENFEAAVKLFREVHKYAFRHPHPTFTISGSNNVVWFSYKAKSKYYREDVDRLLYECGCFFEKENAVINAFDTSLTVLKAHKNNAYFEVAEIMLILYERLLKIEPGYKKRFVRTIKYAKALSPSALKSKNKKNDVKNTHALQVFLRETIGQVNQFAKTKGVSKTVLYDILKGKRESISIKMMKKIVKALAFDEKSFDYPRTINLIIQMVKEEESFEENRNKVSDLSTYELKVMFLKGFMTLVSLEGIDLPKLFKLADKGIEKVFKFISGEPKLIAFFNRCMQFAFKPETVTPYYKARLDLVNQLFSEMDDRQSVTALINLYAGVESIADFEKLNRYFRQYVRYSTTPWRFDVEDVLSERFSAPDYEKVASFCREINISDLFGYLCTWEFEGEERERFVDILTGKV